MANAIPADGSEEVLLEENHHMELNPVSGTAASSMRTEGGQHRPTSRGGGHSSDWCRGHTKHKTEYESVRLSTIKANRGT